MARLVVPVCVSAGLVGKVQILFAKNRSRLSMNTRLIHVAPRTATPVAWLQLLHESHRRQATRTTTVIPHIPRPAFFAVVQGEELLVAGVLEPLPRALALLQLARRTLNDGPCLEQELLPARADACQLGFHGKACLSRAGCIDAIIVHKRSRGCQLVVAIRAYPEHRIVRFVHIRRIDHGERHGYQAQGPHELKIQRLPRSILMEVHGRLKHAKLGAFLGEELIHNGLIISKVMSPLPHFFNHGQARNDSPVYWLTQSFLNSPHLGRFSMHV
mmetsp:Transcript_71891/g.191776  ORF Transcript_71891/g.191776 Transcript_71891/m.191776 type:complete len:272 (+) Transcript_71891:2005-2820(+)